MCGLNLLGHWIITGLFICFKDKRQWIVEDLIRQWDIKDCGWTFPFAKKGLEDPTTPTLPGPYELRQPEKSTTETGTFLILDEALGSTLILVQTPCSVGQTVRLTLL